MLVKAVASAVRILRDPAKNKIEKRLNESAPKIVLIECKQ